MANYNAIKYNGFSKGTLKLIKTLTASSSANLSFVNGTSDVVLDSTYKEYMFIFNNMHPATNSADLRFQGNAAGGSGFDETITNTVFFSQHAEDASYAAVVYSDGRDQAQATGSSNLSMGITNDNDGCAAGYLHLFNPSSTTFVKHFISNTNTNLSGTGYSTNMYTAGYFNTTSAIDEIQFSMSSGNIDAGTVQLFGVS
jgi:hypothetical protein